MDKELLVGRSLFPEMIDAGLRLVEVVDASQLHLHAAFWLQESIDQDWRLVFALPEVRLEGPKWVYKKIKALYKKLPLDEPKIRAESIFVVDDKDRFIQIFKSTIRVEGISGIRFSRNIINGVYLEDAYIYKMT